MRLQLALIEKLAQNAPSVLTWVEQSSEIDNETREDIRKVKEKRVQ